MPLFFILLLLFVGLPMIEIFVLIQVGQHIGAWSTIALLIAIAAVGSALLRRQGLATLATVQAAMARGELPANALLEGLVLVIAGVLMVTPGFVTDLAGFVCLLPPIRRGLARVLGAALLLRAQRGVATRAAGKAVLAGDYRIHREP